MTLILDTPPTTTTDAPWNQRLGAALAEVGALINAHADQPRITHGSFSMWQDRPSADLWVSHPDHVTAWATALGATSTLTGPHEDSDGTVFLIAKMPKTQFEYLEVSVTCLLRESEAAFADVLYPRPETEAPDGFDIAMVIHDLGETGGCAPDCSGCDHPQDATATPATGEPLEALDLV